MNARLTPRARRDLEDILEYIAKENSPAAAQVGRRIGHTIDLIASRPLLDVRNARAPALRSWLAPGLPYRVHYELRGAEVWIVHIRHTARSEWKGV